MNTLDVLDIPLSLDPPFKAKDIGGFFAEFLVNAVRDPSMRWIDDDWIWLLYHAMATNLQPCGEPWIKAVFDSDGALDDLPFEEMAKADALLSGAIRARFGLKLP